MKIRKKFHLHLTTNKKFKNKILLFRKRKEFFCKKYLFSTTWSGTKWLSKNNKYAEIIWLFFTIFIIILMSNIFYVQSFVCVPTNLVVVARVTRTVGHLPIFFKMIRHFSSQNLSLERNFFKWDGKVTKILYLLFHRTFRNWNFDATRTDLHISPLFTLIKKTAIQLFVSKFLCRK